jgi:hypothetical protein
MRGAGCTVNDLLDRDFDRQVARTRHRPLASGALQPHHALAFLSAQLSMALSVLLALPLPAVAAGLAATPLWAGYPLAKRFTDWPQAVLGLAINWGALLGWVAVHGSIHAPVVAPLYVGAFFWTLHYDTIYAHQVRGRIGGRASILKPAHLALTSTHPHTRAHTTAPIDCHTSRALLQRIRARAGLQSSRVLFYFLPFFNRTKPTTLARASAPLR